MLNLSNKNGLIHWEERHIELREYFVKMIKQELEGLLLLQNSSFVFKRVDAPILMTFDKLNHEYNDDAFLTNDNLCLRPETTSGSYDYAKYLLSNHLGYKLPLVIWQHGKSFRREQDHPTKKMRLKEFYQLEFQIIYSIGTKNDYFAKVCSLIHEVLSRTIGACVIEDSDRLPAYSEKTKDIILICNEMELCSISKRKDFVDAEVVEIAIGTDRLLYNY